MGSVLHRRVATRLACLAALAGCAGTPVGPRDRGEPERVVASNVRFEDYAGSAACAACHADVAEGFARSPMQRMTRDALSAEIRAPFTGTLRLGADVATMSRVGERRYVQIDAGGGSRLYRVTEVIGGRYREDYVGVRVSGRGARERLLSDPPTRLVLPVSWILADEEWRYKGYSVQVRERPALAAGPVWSRTCILCHNTAPYLASAYDDLARSRIRYQGSVPSNLLPRARRLRFEVRDEGALEDALAAETARLGAPDALERTSLDTLLRSAARATSDHFSREHLVELGIGCESCHGGAREHVDTPAVRPTYRPVSPMFDVTAEQGELTRAAEINHACARCHSVLFTRYPYTWEGGTRDGDPGGSTVNSGEARDFLLGGCARAMSCTTCHDPHAPDDPTRLAWLTTPAGNVTCTGCHGGLASDGALRAHSHHDPAGEGASCVGCHMPRKNAGLGYALTRYHRIGAPTDPVRVERDRPLECALCHPDATVEETVQTMERWWGRRYDRDRLRVLYGEDLTVSILEATLARGRPHEQTVAIERLGHTRDRRHLPALVEQLAHDYPLVRYYARASIERLAGARPPLDMSAPGAALREAGRAWLTQPRP
ncbi:MAG: hypothetical protein KF729_37840 [Sandaracinaceae bacterium]|nr:hypothetical protein [Sandaracinaceae bacterium]